MISVSIRPFALLICLALAVSGCKPQEGDGRDLSGYKFHPVKGRVVVLGQPQTKGTVTFYPLADPNFIAVGDIQPDGTFELTSIMLGRTELGAPEGHYRVVVSMGGSPDTHYTVVPGENDFTIEFGSMSQEVPRKTSAK